VLSNVRACHMTINTATATWKSELRYLGRCH